MLGTIFFAACGALMILGGLSSTFEAGYTSALAQTPQGVQRSHGYALKGIILCVFGGMCLGFCNVH